MLKCSLKILISVNDTHFFINCCILGSQKIHTCELETELGFPYISIIDSHSGEHFEYTPYRLCLNVYGASQVYISSYSNSCGDALEYFKVNQYTL